MEGLVTKHRPLVRVFKHVLDRLCMLPADDFVPVHQRLDRARPGRRVHQGLREEALINVARNVVQDAQHRREAVAVPVRPSNVRTGRPNVRRGDPDPAGQLADFGALVDGVEDPLDAVVLHRQEKARGELRPRRPGVEERRRGVGVLQGGHGLVGLANAFQALWARRVVVARVEEDGKAKEHVLGRLEQAGLVVALEEVGAEKGPLPKVRQALVAGRNDHLVQHLGVPHDRLVQGGRDQGARVPLVGVGVGLGNGVGKGCWRALVEVRGERSCREAVVVGVVHRVGRSSGGQVAQNFVRVDLVRHALNGLGAEFARVHVVKPARKLVEDGLELALVEGFRAPVALGHNVPR